LSGNLNFLHEKLLDLGVDGTFFLYSLGWIFSE
jgi:hypothetical protein